MEISESVSGIHDVSLCSIRENQLSTIEKQVDENRIKYELRPRVIKQNNSRCISAVTKERKPRSKPAVLSKYRRRTANARERQRMLEINQAFEALRLVIPDFPLTSGEDGKITKITTLRLAMKYIATLTAILENPTMSIDSIIHANDIHNTCEISPASNRLPETPNECWKSNKTFDSYSDSLNSPSEKFVRVGLELNKRNSLDYCDDKSCHSLSSCDIFSVCHSDSDYIEICMESDSESSVCYTADVI